MRLRFVVPFILVFLPQLAFVATMVTVSVTYDIAPAGADDWITAATGSTPITAGYARLQPAAGTTAPASIAIFSSRVNGVLTSETSVAASPLIQQGRIYCSISGVVKTGIAIANPNNQVASISFYFTDAFGNTFGSGTTTVPPSGQIARFLDEAPFASFLNDVPFNGPAAARSFTFTSSVPVAAIALRGYVNERSEFLMTTLPVAPTASTSTDTILLPQVVSGGGWRTEILLVNPTDNPISFRVTSLGPSRQLYSIAPRSSANFEISGGGMFPGAQKVQILPDAGSCSPVASTVFSFVQNGVTVSYNGVATTGTATSSLIFVELTDTLRTGIAIGSDTQAAVRLELLDVNGQPTGLTASVNPSPGAHMSAFLNEIAAFANLPKPFRGILRISADVPIAVVGLRGHYNERNEFLVATTPAVAENAELPGGELIFPHIVNGGGYATEFQLLNPSGRSSGTVVFRSQSGDLLPLPVTH